MIMLWFRSNVCQLMVFFYSYVIGFVPCIKSITISTQSKSIITTFSSWSTVDKITNTSKSTISRHHTRRNSKRCKIFDMYLQSHQCSTISLNKSSSKSYTHIPIKLTKHSYYYYYYSPTKSHGYLINRDNSNYPNDHHNSLLFRRRRKEMTILYSQAKFKNFEEMLDVYYDVPVLVAFSTKLCGPCRMMKKELDLVKETMPKVKIFSIDTDRFPHLGTRYGVKGLPCTVLFKNGNPIYRIQGVKEAEEVIQQIKKFT